MRFNSPKLFSLLWVLLLCTLASAREALTDSHEARLVPLPLIKSQHELFTSLRRRQSNDNCLQYISDPDTPLCIPLCAPSSFYCSSNSVDKRAAVLSRNNLPASGNESSPLSPIQRRAFTALTQDVLQTYLPDQFKKNVYDKIYGEPAGLVSLEGGVDTDATVFVQQSFGNAAFAIGTQGVHGCTILTIVSDTAVWMGHIWEIPTWSSTLSVFEQGALNWITGQGTIHPANGVTFQQGLFSGNIRVYIMHPRRQLGGPYNRARYFGKIPRMQQAIRGVLGADVPIVQYNYIAHNQQEGVQGIALFQFDPNADSDGNSGWRLFYEQNEFRNTDPTPPASAAGGIPEQGIPGG